MPWSDGRTQNGRLRVVTDFGGVLRRSWQRHTASAGFAMRHGAGRVCGAGIGVLICPSASPWQLESQGLKSGWLPSRRAGLELNATSSKLEEAFRPIRRFCTSTFSIICSPSSSPVPSLVAGPKRRDSRSRPARGVPPTCSQPPPRTGTFRTTPTILPFGLGRTDLCIPSRSRFSCRHFWRASAARNGGVYPFQSRNQ